MIIPGFIITWLTFPGVIIHELAHELFCKWTGTPVVKVCYFRFGNPAGFVVHEKPTNVWKHILIGIGPLFINTGIGFTIAMLAFSLKGKSEILVGVLLWLAISIAMHSFPSRGDAKSIWSAIWHKDAPILTRIVGTPLVGLILVGAIGSILWLDLAYGYGVTVGVPTLLHVTK